MDWNKVNENLYIISTVIFAFILVIFLIVSWFMQRKLIKKIFSTKNIAIIAMLSAISVVLTNVLGYSFVFAGGVIRLGLGNFIIFNIGMMFGPFVGMIAGIITDTIGTLINNGGAYHFGFTLSKALFGFAGALVFIWKNNKWFTLKLTAIFSIYFLVYTFVISPISVMAISSSVGASALYTLSKLARTPIELLIYIPLAYITFEIMIQLIQRTGVKKIYVWALRNGSIHFKPKKTLQEKYKIKHNQNKEIRYLKIQK